MNFRVAGAVIGMLFLASCGFSIVPQTDISVGFTPTALGFEVLPSGQINVAAHEVTFTARAGSSGALVTGYRIEFFDKDGNSKIANDNVLQGQGSLNYNVLPGLSCDEALADENYRCSVNDTNIRYVPVTPTLPLGNFVSLDSDVVTAMLDQSQVGDYADVYFNFTDDRGNDDVMGPYQVALAYPVRP